MRRLRPAAGSAVLLVGMLIALGPFISVWRAGGEVLGELPDLDGVDHRDERVGWSAMFDEEFVLARRIFIDVDVDDGAVTEALIADGFEPLAVGGYSKECCGGYDAVWAKIQVNGADQVVVELTAADSDWRLTWPIITGFGLLLAAVGLGVLLTSRSSPRQLTAVFTTS